MNTRILCVDDEQAVLDGIKRTLRKKFDLTTALGPMEGLAAIQGQSPFAVVISDLRMPQMDGIQFLARIQELSPDTVRVMLTGHADTNAAVAAVNEGGLFRFLTKPCPAELFEKTLAAALEHHRLIRAERDLLEQTLRGTLQVLTETLSLTNPAAFSQAARMQTIVEHMVERLGLPDGWQYGVAAMVSQIGCVTLPNDLLDKVYAGVELTRDERESYESHPKTAARLLAKVPRLERVAEMVENHLTVRPLSKAALDTARSEPARLGGQLLRVAAAFDSQVHRGLMAQDVLTQLAAAPREFSPELVATLDGLKVVQQVSPVRSVRLADLAEGMILEQDVRAGTGLLLIARGHEVTPTVLGKLRRYGKSMKIIEPIKVRVNELVPERPEQKAS
jgi:CheY-like chemotaxis protein